MKSVKFFLLAATLAFVSVSSHQTPVVDKVESQNIAGVCPTWPICRGIGFVEQDETVGLSRMTIADITKAV